MIGGHEAGPLSREPTVGLDPFKSLSHNYGKYSSLSSLWNRFQRLLHILCYIALLLMLWNGVSCSTSPQHVHSDTDDPQPLQFDVPSRKTCLGETLLYRTCFWLLLAYVFSRADHFNLLGMQTGTGNLAKNFATPREAMASPLAKKLFGVDGVTQVFFGSDFISVTKNDTYTWAVLKPDIFAAIMDFYGSGVAIPDTFIIFYPTHPIPICAKLAGQRNQVDCS